MWPKFSDRDHPEEIFKNEDYREDLDDCGIARQSRIGQFEVHELIPEIIPEISVQFREYRFSHSREI
jgi:hypothetical protein